MNDGRFGRALRMSALMLAVAGCGQDPPTPPEPSPGWTVVEGTGVTPGGGVEPTIAEPPTQAVAPDAIPLGLFAYAYEVGENEATLGYRFGEGTWQRLVRGQVTAEGTWTLVSAADDTRVLRLSEESGDSTPLVLVRVTADSFAMEAAESVIFQRVEEPELDADANDEGSGAAAEGSMAAQAATEASASPVEGSEAEGVPADAAAPAALAPTGTGTSIRLNLDPTLAPGTTP